MRANILPLTTLALVWAVSGCVGAGTVGGGPGEGAASISGGTNFTLWIHGRNTSHSTHPGDYSDFAYWGPASTAAGVNKKAVNWDGTSHISETNGLIRNALDCFCTGNNWCYVAAHSAGDGQIGYALSLFGSSSRKIKNASPGSDGVCGDAGGTQTGWNIKWVDVAGGAGGGTELANIGAWAVSDTLTDDLRTGTIRSMYDHNNTAGAHFFMFAGAKGTLYSGVLPGQDDEVIAYHSSGAMTKTGSFCNPGDWFCDGTLPLGTSGKWTNHSVTLRDDAEAFNHYANGNWAGIIGPARNDVVNNAR